MTLRHKSIVNLLDIVFAEKTVYMVFEFLNMDLKTFLHRSSGVVFTPRLIKSYMYQLLDSISFCHEKRILLKELKPQSMLVDSKGNIKLHDLGLKRSWDRSYIFFYTAPEILLGIDACTSGVDIWSLGCIFAEMILQRPLFMGDSSIDQLYKIFRTLGTPDRKMWPEVSQMTKMFLKFERANIPEIINIHDAADIFKVSFLLVRFLNGYINVLYSS